MNHTKECEIEYKPEVPPFFIMFPTCFKKHWVPMWILRKLKEPYKVNHLQVPSSLSNPCNLSIFIQTIFWYLESHPLLLLQSSNAFLLFSSSASLCTFLTAFIRGRHIGVDIYVSKREKEKQRQKGRKKRRVWRQDSHNEEKKGTAGTHLKKVAELL